MPNLNVTGEGGTGPRASMQPMMPRRDAGGMMKVLIIIGAIVILVGGIYLLNETGIVHLWGTRPQPPAEVILPPVEEPIPTPPPMQPEAKPTRKPAEKVAVKPMGKGEYTIVIGSFRARQSAENVAARWSEAGFPAIVTEKQLEGVSWHRVSLGRYENRKEALKAAKEMEHMFFEAGYWIDRVR